jgi:Holliday junction resolvasome RuvABC endonuclease subunit
MSRTIIALDPGCTTGWCVRRPTKAVLAAGVWKLSGGTRHESHGMRVIRFERHLNELIRSIDGPVFIAYEEVRRHMGVDAAHMYGALAASIQRVCSERQLDYLAIPVGTVKKLATGKGNAKKDAMLAAAAARWPGIQIEDDNQADAMFIAEAAAREIGE